MNVFYSFNHITIALLVSLIGIIILILIRKKISKHTYLKNIWISAIVFLILYFFIVFTTSIQGIYYWKIYNSYDIDKNGFIENIEKTEGYLKAHRNITNDTARNLAFITGAFVSMFISFIVLAIGFIRTYLFKKKTITK
uniref:hypothetical protein n=1 Tax=Gelidibacter sp. TaxID=2018083 RepID=UPI004049372E